MCLSCYQISTLWYNYPVITPISAKHDFYLFFDMFCRSIKSLLLGMKCVFKHQDSQMFGLKINKYELFSTTLIATSNCLNFKSDNLPGKRLISKVFL